MKIFLALIFLTVSALCLGDGMVIHGKNIATANPPPFTMIEAQPKIPVQRAVLKFDGREEILTIESVIDGPAGKYGWVVPLPTQPTYVKAVRPEYIANSFTEVKPRVLPIEPHDNKLSMLLNGLLCAALLTAGLRYRRQEPGIRVFLFFAELFGGLLLINWIMAKPQEEGAMKADMAVAGAPSSMAKAVPAEEVNVRSLGTIGSYDVNVISGRSSQPLIDWLKDHDIELPANAKPVVEQYVKEGWCFLASEFRKDSASPLPPHPLKAVFPTNKPIYPMRLTALMGNTMHLEMVVVSNLQAEVPHLKLWRSINDPVIVPVPYDRFSDPNKAQSVFKDWHDGLYAMAKDGAIVSYLRGDVSPQQMADDYTVTFHGYERYEAEVHDATQAKDHALWLLIVFLPVGAALLGFGATLLPEKGAVFGLAGLVAAVVIAAGISNWWYRGVEKVETAGPPSYPDSSVYTGYK